MALELELEDNENDSQKSGSITANMSDGDILIMEITGGDTFLTETVPSGKEWEVSIGVNIIETVDP